MKRMACGTAATFALMGLAACFSNPALDLNTDDFHIIQPTPLIAFTKVGDSLQVRLRLVNNTNNGTITSFVIGGVGAGISVRYDDKFRPYYLNGQDTLSYVLDKDMQQYYVKGLAPGKWTFSATATANTAAPAATVTITVEAKDLGAALNKTTGLLPGDTVYVNAPAGLVFSQTSAVTFTTGTAVVVNRKADSTQIKVIVGPGTSGVATVTKVGTAANPTIGVQTLATTNALVAVPNVTIAPTTLSTATPAGGASMTVTLGGSLRFRGDAKILVGTQQGYILSVSADSATATFVPIGGSTGTINYTGVALSFLNSVALTVAGDKTVTAGVVAADPNANSVATASTFSLPAVGTTAVLAGGGSGAWDSGLPCSVGALGGNNGCQYYKIVTTAVNTLALELRWHSGTTTDMGAYLANAAGTALTSGSADGFGDQAGGPETGSWTNLPAGTYYVVIVRWGPAPPSYHLGIKRTL